jgi:hypothetical protein
MPKKLSQAEVFYIAENPQNLSPEKLASDLGYGVNVIKKHLKPKQIEKTVEQPVKRAMSQDENVHMNMGRRVKDGKVISVVMTGAASQKADETRSSRISIKESLKNSIHRPLGNYNPKEHDAQAIIKDLQNQVKELEEKLKNASAV